MIVINKDDLVGAMQMDSDEQPNYLDTHTGEIVLYQEDVSDEPDAPDWQREQYAMNERIEEDAEGRFQRIEAPESSEVYRWMEEYVGTVADRGLQERLIRALRGPRPFRRFKDVLRYTSGSEEGRYFPFYEAKLEVYATEWLASLGLDYRWSEVSP